MSEAQASQYEIVERSIQVDDNLQMRYTVAIPSDIDSSSQRPLILALHYGWQGDIPRSYGRGFLMSLVLPALSNVDAILVAPDCPDVDWQQSTSETALMSLLEQLQEEFPVATEKIVVTGFSLGGMGAWYLANRHPSLFSAAIPMAAPPILTKPNVPVSTVIERLSDGVVDTIDVSSISIPIYAIHGREDEVIPLSPVESTVTQLQELGAQIQFVVVDGASHYNLAMYFAALSEAGEWLLELWGRNED